MKLCPYCDSEASAIGAGDEFLDYCSECELVIEGHTVDEQTEKERKAFKRNPDLSYNTRVIHQLSWADFA